MTIYDQCTLCTYPLSQPAGDCTSHGGRHAAMHELWKSGEIELSIDPALLDQTFVPAEECQ